MKETHIDFAKSTPLSNPNFANSAPPLSSNFASLQPKDPTLGVASIQDCFKSSADFSLHEGGSDSEHCDARDSRSHTMRIIPHPDNARSAETLYVNCQCIRDVDVGAFQRSPKLSGWGFERAGNLGVEWEGERSGHGGHDHFQMTCDNGQSIATASPEAESGHVVTTFSDRLAAEERRPLRIKGFADGTDEWTRPRTSFKPSKDSSMGERGRSACLHGRNDDRHNLISNWLFEMMPSKEVAYSRRVCEQGHSLQGIQDVLIFDDSEATILQCVSVLRLCVFVCLCACL